MSIIAGILVVLFGKLFRKFELQEYDIIFWVTIVSIFLIILLEAMIIYKISQKTKEIKDL